MKIFVIIWIGSMKVKLLLQDFVTYLWRKFLIKSWWTKKRIAIQFFEQLLITFVLKLKYIVHWVQILQIICNAWKIQKTHYLENSNLRHCRYKMKRPFYLTKRIPLARFLCFFSLHIFIHYEIVSWGSKT